jgi:hypothetical protein
MRWAEVWELSEVIRMRAGKVTGDPSSGQEGRQQFGSGVAAELIHGRSPRTDGAYRSVRRVQ